MRGRSIVVSVETVRNNLLTVGVSDCKWWKVHLLDVNLSVMPEGSTEFGTRTEMKNLNSFRSLKRAIEYEYKRQVKAVEKGVGENSSGNQKMG